MQDVDLTAVARKLFCGDRYACEQTGIQIVAVAPHYAQCRINLDSRHKNAMGGVMGGVLFTLADFTFAIAANSECLTESSLHWVSLNSHITFLSNTHNTILTATSRCIRHGHNNCVYCIDIVDNDGKMLATITTTGTKI